MGKIILRITYDGDKRTARDKILKHLETVPFIRRVTAYFSGFSTEVVTREYEYERFLDTQPTVLQDQLAKAEKEGVKRAKAMEEYMRSVNEEN